MGLLKQRTKNNSRDLWPRVSYSVGKESVSSEVKEITATMDRYYKDLSSIEAVIRNWDPIKKTIVILFSSLLIPLEYRDDDIIISSVGNSFYDEV